MSKLPQCSGRSINLSQRAEEGKSIYIRVIAELVLAQVEQLTRLLGLGIRVDHLKREKLLGLAMQRSLRFCQRQRIKLSQCINTTSLMTGCEEVPKLCVV